ncbi:MAG: ABC transporter substrate-binding protein [Bacteroidales bacterium]|nr:ABC transporter substrate-binding protein [Bacteroidales bacterium]
MKILKLPSRLLITCILTSSMFVFGCKNQNENIIRIGAILPLTGALSEIGTDEKLAIDMAVEEFDVKKKIKIEYRDSKGNVKESLSAAAQLINQGVNKIILSTTSVVIANLEKYQDTDLLFLAQCMAPQVVRNYKNALRIYISVDLETDLIKDYVNKNQYGKLSYFYINNDFGQSAINEIKSKINSNIETQIESFSYQDKNYQNQILKIINYNPDAIIIYSYPQQWLNILKQVEQYKFENKIIANSGASFLLNEIEELKISKKLVVPLPKYIYEKNDTLINKFKDLLAKRTSKSANYDIIYFYDMMKILIENIYAYPNANNSELINFITSKDYIGISGDLKFFERDIKSLDLKLSEIDEIKEY